MHLYPDLAAPRNRQIVRDVLVVMALALFALFAWAVHSAVMTLTAISAGFTDNAAGAQESWSSAGRTLSRIPFVGDDLQRSLEDLSNATLGSAVETGNSITEAVTTAANVLAFVTFAAPAAVLLVLFLPRRWDRSRAWTAADRVLSAIEVNPDSAVARRAAPSVSAADPEQAPEPGEGQHDTIVLPWGAPGEGVPTGSVRTGPALVAFPPDELMALRALCDLPFVDLVRYTPRPFEAFYAGDYAPLIRALYAHEGLEPPM
jgi:hypothetical protein